MATKKYANAAEYEAKLSRVMERIGATEYDYDWTRKTAFVRFKYKDQWFQFDHSTDKANENAAASERLVYGTDVFAQIVLTIEDLARMAKRNIYDIGQFIVGMKYLPPVVELPECFKILGFTGSEKPTKEDIQARYRNLAKERHPDAQNGNEKLFKELREAAEQCIREIE